MIINIFYFKYITSILLYNAVYYITFLTVYRKSFIYKYDLTL